MARFLLLLLCVLAVALAACGAASQGAVPVASPADTPESVAKAALTALAAGDQAALTPLLGDELSSDARDDMRIQWRGSSCNTLQGVDVLGTRPAGSGTEVRLKARCAEAVDGLAFTLAPSGGTYRIVDWRMLPFEELEK